MSQQNQSIAVLLPVYDEDNEKEEARIKLFASHPAIKEIYLNLRTIEVRCEGVKDTILPKGLAIRYKFLDKEKGLKEYDIVMLIDGTGKIDYSAVKTIKKEFEKNNDLDVVFGEREDNDWGISEYRKEIEFFENYVIMKGLKISATSHPQLVSDGNVKDCQCGCWAFRTKHLDLFKANLSAYAYDIELDVFITAILQRKKSKFIKVTIANSKNSKTRDQLQSVIDEGKENGLDICKLIEAASLLREIKSTKFNFSNNLEKLVYICLKLNITKNKLAKYMTEYLNTREIFKRDNMLKRYKEIVIHCFKLEQFQ